MKNSFDIPSYLQLPIFSILVMHLLNMYIAYLFALFS